MNLKSPKIEAAKKQNGISLTMDKENISILIVDDLQFSREFFRSGLKKAGFKDLRTAESGVDALLLLHRRRADVILVDFWMPKMTGLQLTEFVRRWDHKDDRYTGVVLITAEDSTSSIVSAFDSGVNDFVSKDAHQSEIAARVYGAARTAEQQNELRDKNRQINTLYQGLQSDILIDKESGLENKRYLQTKIEAMIKHGAKRGGGIGLGVIQVTGSQNSPITLCQKTLHTIASALKLVMRPLDIICRLDSESFAVAVHFNDIDNFDDEIFKRLLENLKTTTKDIKIAGQELFFLSNLHITTEFDPMPTSQGIIDQTLEGLS